MNSEKLNGLFEIIELILNKEHSIIDSFLFDSLESYINVFIASSDEQFDTLIDDIVDLCSEINSGDDCIDEKNKLKKIYFELKEIEILD